MQKNNIKNGKRHARSIQILRIFIFFYSREHEPLHIHVEGNGGMAKFIWNGKEFELFEKQKIKANDYKKIKQVIDDNADIIISRWKEYFEK